MTRCSIPPFLTVMRVQSRGSCKELGHSWLVAYSSKIAPCCALAALAGDTVHNPILNPTHPESAMPECFMERWTC